MVEAAQRNGVTFRFGVTVEEYYLSSISKECKWLMNRLYYKMDWRWWQLARVPLLLFST